MTFALEVPEAPGQRVRFAVRWLRISFLTGAVIDLLAAIQLAFPSIFVATTMGLSDFNPTVEFRYAMGTGASLMLGWTLLLVWALQKPMERKDVLVLTAVPVVVGLMANELRSISEDFLEFRAVLPILILQTVLIGLFVASYWYARLVELKARQGTRLG